MHKKTVRLPLTIGSVGLVMAWHGMAAQQHNFPPSLYCKVEMYAAGGQCNSCSGK